MKDNYKNLTPVREIRDIKDLLCQSVSLFGNNTAFLTKVDGEYEPRTYNEFKKDVDALGTYLISKGFSGKKIAIIGENRYEWALAYMAIVCGVGIVVPLDKELPYKELLQLMETAGLDAIFYSPKVNYPIEDVNIEAKFNMDELGELIAEGDKLVQSGDTSFTGIEIDNEKMQVLLFTSGTTSDAKAVMLSHKNIAYDLENANKLLNIFPSDIFLSVLPLHHTYESTCGLLSPLYTGSAIAYCEGLRYITKNLAESKATVMLGVPLLFESIYNKIQKQAKKTGQDKKLNMALKLSNALLKAGIDLRSKLFKSIYESLGGHIRLFIAGAAAIDPVVSKGFRDFGIKIVQGYGLTECSPIVALNRDEIFKDEAAGLPLPGVTVEIENKDEDGIGEIVVSGDNVMMGYYNNKQATDEVLKNGRFYTGDLGIIDEDGFVHITGRKKNVIVTKNGKNIFPEEIEAHLNRSPYILESMVYGEDREDGDTTVVVQIVPDMAEFEKDFGENVPEEKIKEKINEEVRAVNHSLQNYKRIGKTIIRHDEFVKTTTRKIKRHIEINQNSK